ncbi:hypothetical protein ACG0Z4_21985 [Enterocloster aldenensis]|uniref:hypothetical protein n=1 Tax=Enterocloster aldenensis TaxID=358742 RepID=UPI002639BD94|nr:hypothetical protein [uncultured Lachnoclostridium sp.]
MVKIAFEEEKINMVLMLMNQLRVEGVQQAGYLVSMNNILTKGEKVEPKEKVEETKKEVK